MWRLLVAVAFIPVCAFAQPASSSFQRAPVQYVVIAPALHGSAPVGWGLYAIDKGRSLDLSMRGSNWSDDPAAPLGESEVGYGWWGGRTATVFGYIEHDNRTIFERPVPIEAHNPNTRSLGHSAVIGLGFVLRTH